MTKTMSHTETGYFRILCKNYEKLMYSLGDSDVAEIRE